MREFYRPAQLIAHVVNDSDNLQYWADGDRASDIIQGIAGVEPLSVPLCSGAGCWGTHHGAVGWRYESPILPAGISETGRPGRRTPCRRR